MRVRVDAALKADCLGEFCYRAFVVAQIEKRLPQAVVCARVSRVLLNRFAIIRHSFQKLALFGHYGGEIVISQRKIIALGGRRAE